MLDLSRDRGETHLVASGDVEGAPRTCAGTMLRESPLDSVGHLKPDAHRYAGMFQGYLQLFRCISGTEAFFLVGKGDWRAMFDRISSPPCGVMIAVIRRI